MRVFKKPITIIILIALCVSICSSCFGVIFVPVISTIAGLPGYTLTEKDVKEAKDYLATAKKAILNDATAVETNVAWNDFMLAYYEIASQANVAYILYASDSSNQTYKDNYLFASEAYNDIYSDYLSTLKDIYLSEQEDGVSKEESFFRELSESEINRIVKHSEQVAQLETEVEELQMDYASLSKDEFYDESVTIYKQIIAKNNQIATLYGFDNYYEYASEYVYGRDATITDINEFRQNVGEYVPQIITELNSDLQSAKEKLSDSDRKLLNEITTSAYNKSSVNYWDKYVNSYEGKMKGYLSHAFDNQNVMLANGTNSREMAFNAYLPAYSKSFCYFGPGYQDLFTISHEIGHYYANYHSILQNTYGDASMDLKETHSQANEMLLLEFLSSQLTANSFDALEASKLVSMMSTVIVSTIVDEFEYFVYTNDVSGYTSADFDAKMNQICANYGGRAFIDTIATDINNYWRLVAIEHPVYYLSYATSGIASISLYVKADESRASARAIYQKLVEDTPSNLGFAGGLKNAGLLDPFKQETFEVLELYLVGVEVEIPEYDSTESAESTEEQSDLAA